MPDAVIEEPPVDSVILVHGYSGTAWQRHRSDGLWYSTTEHWSDWASLSTEPNIILIYTPKED